MFLRSWFKNSNILGQSPRPSNRMIAVVYDEKAKKYVPRSEWIERQRVEAELEVQKRMAASLEEPYDTSFRSPVSATRAQGYDFSQ